MAYPNGYFPTFYQPQVQIPQPIPQQIPQQQMMVPQQSQMQIQNGGFLSVPNEEIAVNYPVAPGNCVTFKIEGKPIVMEKSMGFSQLESPRVERYRLVKEEPTPVQNPTSIPVQKIDTPVRDFGAELDRVWDEIDALKRITGKKEEPSDADTDA